MGGIFLFWWYLSHFHSLCVDNFRAYRINQVTGGISLTLLQSVLGNQKSF